MKYAEFRDSAKQYGRMWILTVGGRNNQLRVIHAQWEPSNAKWYTPRPFEGRIECGYTNEVWFDNEPGNWLILDIR